MARKTLELPEASNSESGDFFYLYDTSTGLSKRIDHDNMPGGGTSDHTQLTNIGVKTHATLDTEVGLNTAKVSIPPGGTAAQVLQKIDGTDYNTEWVDASGGGGGGSNLYTQSLWVDSPSSANWVGLKKTDLSNNEYSQNTSLASTSSIITILNSTLGGMRPFVLVLGNQTINGFKLYAASSTFMKKISIVKVSWITQTTIDAIDVLFEGDITLDSKNTFDIPDTSFANTTLTDKDLVYVFFHCNTLNDVGAIAITLKTTDA
jgi:hypothetical protein